MRYRLCSLHCEKSQTQNPRDGSECHTDECKPKIAKFLVEDFRISPNLGKQIQSESLGALLLIPGMNALVKDTRTVYRNPLIPPIQTNHRDAPVHGTAFLSRYSVTLACTCYRNEYR